jgi:hypothetical protein
VARAKRTDRAEARRRYRAELGTRDATDVESTDGEEPGAVDARRRQPSRAAPTVSRAASGPPRQPGLLGGLRSALQPANVREDIAAVPKLLRTNWLLWIPFALVFGAGVVALIPSLGAYQIPAFLVQTFVFPPPLIGPFLAGLLAPRAGWLFGLLTGLVGGVMFALFAATSPGTSAAGGPAITPDVRLGYIAYGLVTSPTFGAAIGAFAGFYRRFLRTTTPRRAPTSRRPTNRTRR